VNVSNPAQNRGRRPVIVLIAGLAQSAETRRGGIEWNHIVHLWIGVWLQQENSLERC